MSSLEYMKKECVASGTLSSASLKGTLTKIHKRKVAPKTHQDSDGEFCRSGCSVLPLFGNNRSVHRILTACLLSFLALLGSVSMDLSSNLDLLGTTEDAYYELTSCKTLAILRLISELQNMRALWTKRVDNKTGEGACVSEMILPLFGRLSEDLEGHSDSQGQPCGVDLTDVCQELNRDFSEFLNSTRETDGMDGNGKSVFSVTISKLLDTWGTIEESVAKVKDYLCWRDVLALRLLVAFTELNRQLMDDPRVGMQTDFQHQWSHTLSYLSFAQVMSENLHVCWLENVDPKSNSTHRLPHTYILGSDLWQISKAGADTVSGSPAGIGALRDAQECLLARAVPALRLVCRDVFSGLSMRVCLLVLACLIYPLVMVSFKQTTEWIQSYARSLRDRTEDLKHQRQLAEDLLNQMLPKSVVKQLSQHKHVEAESYEKVTIFFSDIVGFTSISALCSPLQVVEMLNNLYMCFDTRIDSYDVYKVETIGDAYMVVSGLPERNGDRHADEIAKMSLDLVAAVRQVPIPHMQNQRLQLRAGIHTGPCVAGIVGYKMPRYCLFGDTVNTASRMESTSLPQRIHTSSAAYLALMKDNAYELQLRGEIEVKGKGKMNTYWLIGHKNYSVQNDSLVCHWNPNLAKKKKRVTASDGSMANSCMTVQSHSENTPTPISQLPQTPPQPRSDGPGGLCVSAQVAHSSSSYGTLGSMIGGLHGGDESPVPGVGRPCAGDKPDLLPGSIPLM